MNTLLKTRVSTSTILLTACAADIYQAQQNIDAQLIHNSFRPLQVSIAVDQDHWVYIAVVAERADSLSPWALEEGAPSVRGPQ